MNYKAKQRQATAQVQRAVASGELIRPDICELFLDDPDHANGSQIVAHHWRGYDYPLAVWWICESCNHKLHGPRFHSGQVSKLETREYILNYDECAKFEWETDPSHLVDFINTNLNKRGWKASELSRRSGVTEAALSRILNQGRNAGPDTCVGLAAAFGESPEQVCRLAGLLPPLPQEQRRDYMELVEIAGRLSDTELDLVLNFVKWRYQSQEPQ